jgi:prevent-host-death family protein
MEQNAATWPVVEAKARFSELMDRAINEGPQTVTRKGRAAVVVVAAEEWARKVKRNGSLAEFLLRSPLRDSGLDLDRLSDEPREIEL